MFIKSIISGIPTHSTPHAILHIFNEINIGSCMFSPGCYYEMLTCGKVEKSRVFLVLFWYSHLSSYVIIAFNKRHVYVAIPYEWTNECTPHTHIGYKYSIIIFIHLWHLVLLMGNAINTKRTPMNAYWMKLTKERIFCIFMCVWWRLMACVRMCNYVRVY